MRIDKFLKLSRVIKRRTIANEACDSGRISVNGKIVKASFEVKQGDILFTLMPNIPESGNIWLGASQIGAIADFADPRPDSLNPKVSAQKILKIVQEEKINSIVALDQCYLAMVAPVEHELKELGIDNVLLKNVVCSF